jgi:thiol-disulfide isomerase/thioredoxin
MRFLVFGLAATAMAVLAIRADDPPQPETAPEFQGIGTWLNGEPLTMAGLRGKVVVVHFWTHGCINCIHNYPALKRWQEKYAGKGVTIIGVHTPEFDREKDVERIKAKAKENGLTYAIAVDNDRQTWRAWRNRYWPSVYLVDRRGRVRYHWEGELNYGDTKGEQVMAKHIDELLAEKGE